MKADRINQALSMLLAHEQGTEEYQVAAFAINAAMSDTHRRMLARLVQDGPVSDRSLRAKGAREDLVAWGLATEICVRGSQNYTGANCRGLAVHQAAK
jgi:hypothetical protein